MRHSLESLAAFAQVASEGSFSAAARKLGKSQSTISETIANLEVDLNVTLFNRSQRQPALTEAGQVLLGQALQVLAANDRFNRSANQLADGLEPRLTVVLSDTFQSKTFENMLSQIDQRYPALRFECLIAEYEDVVALVQQGRAHLGLMAAQDDYPGRGACDAAGTIGNRAVRGSRPPASRPSRRQQRRAQDAPRIAAQHLRTGRQGHGAAPRNVVRARLSDAAGNGQPGVRLDRTASLDDSAFWPRPIGGTDGARLAAPHTR